MKRNTKFSVLLMSLAAFFLSQPTSAQFRNLIPKKTKKIDTELIQLLFSTEPIAADNPDATKLSTQFEAEGNIFVRLNLGALLSEIVYTDKPDHINSSIAILYTQKEKTYSVANIAIKDTNDYDTYEFNINPNPERDRYNKLYRSLNSGTNTIKFFARLGSDDYAFTEIKLLKKDGVLLKMNKSFDDYKAQMINPKLEAGILKAIQKTYTDADSKIVVKGVKISTEEWFIEKNAITGMVFNRQLGAYCYAQWPDGHCTVQKYTVAQDYNGSSFSDTFRRYSSGDINDVDCK